MTRLKREFGADLPSRAKVKLRAFDPSGGNGLGIEVDIARGAGTIELTYFVFGDIGVLALPEAGAPVRTDKLWEMTCLELFVGPVGHDNYCEFNFSPSSAWAAYRFSGCRRGMQILPLASPPAIDRRETAKTLALKVALGLDLVPGLPEDGDWRVGLSAVIESESGVLSYWALNHPADKPDFHHNDCFALTLAPPVKP